MLTEEDITFTTIEGKRVVAIRTGPTHRVVLKTTKLSSKSVDYEATCESLLTDAMGGQAWHAFNSPAPLKRTMERAIGLLLDMLLADDGEQEGVDAGA